MPQNFIACDREQVLLLPPDLKDWLAEDHLAWFVLDAVAEMDLSAFYGAYRADGHGRAAHDPAMMVALLFYAYAKGQRSSRGIERECVEDVAYRVIAVNQAPDHATIARFRARHEDALAGLFSSVLGLCALGRDGEGRGDRGRRHEGPRQRVASLKPRLRADRQGDPC
jgi:transposase